MLQYSTTTYYVLKISHPVTFFSFFFFAVVKVYEQFWGGRRPGTHVMPEGIE